MHVPFLPAKPTPRGRGPVDAPAAAIGAVVTAAGQLAEQAVATVRGLPELSTAAQLRRQRAATGRRVAAVVAGAVAAVVLARRRGVSAPRSAPEPPPAYETPAAGAAGAPGAAAALAEEAAQEARTPDGATLHADDLPIEDYDHLTVGTLHSRIRSLTVGELSVLRAYEAAHAHRLQVTTLLDNRIARLRAQESVRGADGEGAAASDGSAVPSA
ncbi:hypothetical protein [Motilibacter aurantiacus]|uniref:hypothetical protein n=1 Tax=Motilibacter aurantiacus TaxID=2714955 RepID=UPI00140B515C|nr:hypothetical protein [Motilibacter aurantiacus]NHC45776.1 hypothetical protein [Motilibacter aurantiacus]